MASRLPADPVIKAMDELCAARSAAPSQVLGSRRFSRLPAGQTRAQHSEAAALPVFNPHGLTWHCSGPRPLARSVIDDRPYGLMATVPVWSTQFRVEPWQTTRTWPSRLVGTVQHGGHRWLSRYQECPTEDSAQTRESADFALASQYARIHVTVQHQQRNLT